MGQQSRGESARSVDIVTLRPGSPLWMTGLGEPWHDQRMGVGAQIWCLRHGESSNVVAGQSGAVPGAALTRAGRAQAVAAAATLAGLPRRPTRVYTSTAVRAIQTADLLPSELKLSQPLVPLNGLVEVGPGRTDASS